MLRRVGPGPTSVCVLSFSGRKNKAVIIVQSLECFSSRVCLGQAVFWLENRLAGVVHELHGLWAEFRHISVAKYAPFVEQSLAEDQIGGKRAIWDDTCGHRETLGVTILCLELACDSDVLANFWSIVSSDAAELHRLGRFVGRELGCKALGAVDCRASVVWEDSELVAIVKMTTVDVVRLAVAFAEWLVPVR